MTNKQARRLLLVALALSLLVHVLVATRMTWPFWPARDTVQIERIEHIRVLHVAKQPTPPPPTASPQPSPVASLKPTKAGKNGTAPQHVASAPTPEPTPVASQAPKCDKSDTDAAMTAQPDVDLSKIMDNTVRGEGKSGTTAVLVKLDPNGAVLDTTVAVTSGSPALDLVAISILQKATYSPATHDCKPIASQVTVQVPFTAW